MKKILFVVGIFAFLGIAFAQETPPHKHAPIPPKECCKGKKCKAPCCNEKKEKKPPPHKHPKHHEHKSPPAHHEHTPPPPPPAR